MNAFLFVSLLTEAFMPLPVLSNFKAVLINAQNKQQTSKSFQDFNGLFSTFFLLNIFIPFDLKKTEAESEIRKEDSSLFQSY